MRTHTQAECVPPCPTHAPSDHHMTDWPLVWRQDRWYFERICPHGIGHPDPDSLAHAPEGAGVHGCDGCCRKESQ